MVFCRPDLLMTTMVSVTITVVCGTRVTENVLFIEQSCRERPTKANNVPLPSILCEIQTWLGILNGHVTIWLLLSILWQVFNRAVSIMIWEIELLPLPYSPAFLAEFLSQATSVGDIVRWYLNRRFIGILSHLTLPVSLVPSPEVLVRRLHYRLYIEASVPAWISVLYTEITDRILQSIHYSFANRFTSDA